MAIPSAACPLIFARTSRPPSTTAAYSGQGAKLTGCGKRLGSRDIPRLSRLSAAICGLGSGRTRLAGLRPQSDVPWLRVTLHQVAYANQVVSRCREREHPADSLQPAMAHLAE